MVLDYNYTIHSISFREGYYEVLYDVLDLENNLIIGNLVSVITKKYPEQEDLDDKFEKFIFKRLDKEFKKSKKDRGEEENYTTSEVTQILRDKGYIDEDTEFGERMPDNE